MKKLIFALIFIFTFAIVFLSAIYAEEVTITTYYPAPEGVYKKLGVGTKDSLTVPLEVRGGGSSGGSDPVLRLSSEGDPNRVLDMGMSLVNLSTRWIQAYKIVGPNYETENLLLNPFPNPPNDYNGKVGIGITDFKKNAKLEIAAPDNMVPIAVQQDTSSPTASFIDCYDSSNYAVGSISLGNTGGIDTFGFDAKTLSTNIIGIGLQTDNTTRLFIKGGTGADQGNVGIGTTTPDEKFEVEWSTNPDVDVEIGRGTVHPRQTFIALRDENGTKRYITVTTGGNVVSSLVHP